MVANIGPTLSLIAQRIVPAQPTVAEVSPQGQATVIKRYKDGLIPLAQFLTEMLRLGYPGPRIMHAQDQAQLDREYDLWQLRLAAVKENYMDDRLTDEAMKYQLLQLIPDQEIALATVALWRYIKAPKVEMPPPEKIVELTVGQLLAGFLAGALTEAQLRAELAARRYTPTDIAILVATEKAKEPKPTPIKQAQLSLADLRALFDLGQITQGEFRAQLLLRLYTEQDADRIINLQLARQRAKVLKPTVAQVKEIPLADLKAQLTLGVITPEEFYLELLDRHYSETAAENETLLLLAKMEPSPAP